MKIRVTPFCILSAALLSCFAVHGQNARQLVIRQDGGGIGLAFQHKPLALTWEEGLFLLPGLTVESSEDLENWTPMGDPTPASLSDSLESRVMTLSLDGSQRFYRVRENLDFSGMNLSGAELSFADLRGADFSGTNLSDADLRGVNLSGANLQGANLTGANLVLADLTEASANDDELESALQLPEDPFMDGPFTEADLATGAVPWGGAGGFAPSVGSIGLTTGGANDVNSFRANLENDFLPLFTDVTYEGLFSDYFFETGESEACEDLFCPVYAQAVSRDPFSGESEVYLAVGLNSGIQESDFQRKQLNLVIVLDVSGSMGVAFDQYYYDRFGRRIELEEEGIEGQTKMEVANRAVAALLDHLSEGDRIGIVTFNNNSRVRQPLTAVEDIDMEDLKETVLEFHAGGGTAFSAGMELGTRLFEDVAEFNPDTTENRLIFLTDAMPNIGELSENGLFGMIESNAGAGIYSTVIGIGVDFNSELIDAILKNRGANYYTVRSPSQFIERMDEGFDYMVTPLVFDLNLSLTGGGYAIEKVYGSPEADEATGELMKVNTLFPSKRVDGETRGGLVLLKLKKSESDAEAGNELTLGVSYEDRVGAIRQSESTVEIVESDPDAYDHSGIRKGILLTRYANLLKNWINDERSSYIKRQPVVPTVNEHGGIIIPEPYEHDWGVMFPNPSEVERWERQSLSLFVSKAYRDLFSEFIDYFQSESEALNDETLAREMDILLKLSGQTAAAE